MPYTAFGDETIRFIYGKYLDFFLSSLSSGIKDLFDPTISSALEVFHRVREVLLPTPAKSHYLYNLRDISKVIQGICQVDKSSIERQKDFFLLWYHENERVYKDRLIEAEDEKKLAKILNSAMNEHFAEKLEDIHEGKLVFSTIGNKGGSYVLVLDIPFFVS